MKSICAQLDWVKRSVSRRGSKLMSAVDPLGVSTFPLDDAAPPEGSHVRIRLPEDLHLEKRDR